MSLLRAYQEQVRRGLMIAPGTDPIAHCALGLTGEAGEVADMVKKSQYLKPKPIEPSKMMEELGDVLWYLTALADKYGWDIEALAKFNIAKLEERHGEERYSYDRLLQRAGLLTDCGVSLQQSYNFST